MICYHLIHFQFSFNGDSFEHKYPFKMQNDTINSNNNGCDKLNMMFYVHKYLIENNVFAQILYDHVQYDKKGKE